MQGKFFPQEDVKDCARDDAVELLSRSEDVGRPREGYREMIVLDESSEMQFTTGAGGSVGRTWIEGRLLGHIPAAAAVHFGSRNMDILLKKIEMAKPVVEFHVCDNIRLVPMLGMKPAFRDHALGDKVNNIIRLEIADALRRPVDIVIEIELGKLKIPGLAVLPLVREKHPLQFQGATDAEDANPAAEQVIDEMTSGEGIASQNNSFLCH